jgi:hypothetical protein
MNSTKVVVGCSLVVLSLACIGQLMLDKPERVAPESQTPVAEPVAQSETHPVPADEVIGTFLPSITTGEEAERLNALAGFLDVMEGAEYSRMPIGEGAASSLAEALIPQIHEATAQAKESWELKLRAARLIVGRTKSDLAKSFVIQTLESGPADLQAAVAGAVGRPEGVGGRSVFAKLQQTAGLPAGIYTAALRRTGGKKAIEPILAIMRSTAEPDVVSACAIALQDYRDPALLGQALERLEQTGLIDDGNKMPWISAALLNAHLETAEGSALARGIKVLRSRPTMARHGAAIFERAFEKGDEETRRIASDAVKKAVMIKTVDAEMAEKWLAAHPEQRAEPVLKAALPAPEGEPKPQ